jgi:hypothetical protein
MSRTLVLRKESLTELATDELAAVAGASHHCVTYSVVPTGCICTGPYPSLNIDCKTVSITDAIVGTVEVSYCVC